MKDFSFSLWLGSVALFDGLLLLLLAWMTGSLDHIGGFLLLVVHVLFWSATVAVFICAVVTAQMWIIGSLARLIASITEKGGVE